MIRAWCWPCIMAGAGLLLVSAPSFAQSESAGLGWRDVALAAVGLVMVLAGAFMRSLDVRVAAVTAEARQTRETLLRDYHPKDEIRETVASALAPTQQAVSRIEIQITALHRRLDQSRIPFAAPEL